MQNCQPHSLSPLLITLLNKGTLVLVVMKMAVKAYFRLAFKGEGVVMSIYSL